MHRFLAALLIAASTAAADSPISFRYSPAEGIGPTPGVSANGGAHGNNGLSLLFVDGHSQFTRYNQLYPTSTGFFNFDWTVNGLAGMDANN